VVPVTAVPRKTPCATCPYRQDVPAGVWSPDEYVKLPPYDSPTYEQPVGIFMCHQGDGKVCAGWAAVHGDTGCLALRMAGTFDPLVDREAVIAYTTDVPLFSSGTEAAEHGLGGTDNPDAAARAAVAKIMRTRAARRRKGGEL
jgi:hypothetical protein